MRTTISLPDPVLENAKQRASERGITLSEFVAEAVASHITASEVQHMPAPFRLPSVAGGTVNPNVDLNRISQLIEEEDAEWYKARFSR